jgi:hypothetical protein
MPIPVSSNYHPFSNSLALKGRSVAKKFLTWP